MFEDNTHVFIVRVWFERREIEDAPVTWRGVIEHVPSCDRRYLKHLDEISAFIKPYLEQKGVVLGRLHRVKRWLNGLKMC